MKNGFQFGRSFEIKLPHLWPVIPNSCSSFFVSQEGGGGGAGGGEVRGGVGVTDGKKPLTLSVLGQDTRFPLLWPRPAQKSTPKPKPITNYFGLGKKKNREALQVP